MAECPNADMFGSILLFLDTEIDQKQMSSSLANFFFLNFSPMHKSVGTRLIFFTSF